MESYFSKTVAFTSGAFRDCALKLHQVLKTALALHKTFQTLTGNDSGPKKMDV